MINLFKVGMSATAPIVTEEVLLSGYVGQGKIVDEFEKSLKDELSIQSYPVTVNSATSAIDLALHLIGVGPDDEVISTPQTCFASNVHVVHRGAKIRWADIDPITGLIDPRSVSELVNHKTKCIIAVNWGGRIADYAQLKNHSVPVIEDAAHNWDTHLKSNIPRGDYIVYSFQAIKFLTSVDGGILIPPPRDVQMAKSLRWYGLDRDTGESFRCTQDISYVGFKYHMNNLNAAIGKANIPFANHSVSKSREHSKELCKRINNPKIIIPEWDENCSYWLFSIHILNNEKDLFMSYMTKNGIETSPVHFRNDLYSSMSRFREGKLPGVDQFTDTQVCIPNGFWLTSEDLEKIINLVNSF